MCLHPAGQPGRSLNTSELCRSSLGCRQTHVPLMDCRSNYINTESTAHFTSSSDGTSKRPETTEITAADATDAEFLPIMNVCVFPQQSPIFINNQITPITFTQLHTFTGAATHYHRLFSALLRDTMANCLVYISPLRFFHRRKGFKPEAFKTKAQTSRLPL